jgi:hypothetical protein
VEIDPGTHMRCTRLCPLETGVTVCKNRTSVKQIFVSHSLFAYDLFFTLSLSDSFIFLTLTRLVVVLKFVNSRFALFTPL